MSKISSPAIALAFTFALAACGGGGGDVSNTSGVVASAPATGGGSGESRPPSADAPAAPPASPVAPPAPPVVPPAPPPAPSEEPQAPPAQPPVVAPPVEPPPVQPVTPPVPSLPQAPAAAARPSVSYAVKSFSFNWSAVPSATFYRIGSSPVPDSGASGGVSVVADKISALTLQVKDIELSSKIGGLYMQNYFVQACNDVGCGPWSASATADPNRAVGYFKGVDATHAEQLGRAVAISGDGKTMALGAPEYADAAGRVVVYTNRDGKGWISSPPLSIALPNAGDRFGQAVALSDDGSTLAVGVPGIFGQGVVMVFRRMESDGHTYWAQYKSLPSNTAQGNEAGTSVAISGDGRTVAFGAPGQDYGAGAVYVADLSVNALPIALFPPVQTMGARFGERLDLSADGKTLIAGMARTGSSASRALIFRGSSLQWQNTNSLQNPNSWMPLGFVPSVALSGDGTRAALGDLQSLSIYFRMDAGNYISTGGVFDQDYSGGSLAFSSDGKRLLAGLENSRARGEGVWAVPETDPTVSVRAGAVAILDEAADHTWSTTRVIKATNPEDGDAFGAAVGISADGKTILVGAPKEAGGVPGVNGNQTSNSQPGAGAAYLY